MLSTYLPNFRKITLQHNLLCHTYKMVLISNSEINSWSLLLQFVLFYGNIPLSNFSKLGVYPHKAVSQSLFCLLVYLVLQYTKSPPQTLRLSRVYNVDNFRFYLELMLLVCLIIYMYDNNLFLKTQVQVKAMFSNSDLLVVLAKRRLVQMP